MVKYTRIALLLFLDLICVNFSYIFSFLVRFNFQIGTDDLFWRYFAAYADNILILTAIKIVVFWFFGLYRSLWK